MVSDLFSRIVRSCHAKCIDDKYYADGQLNKGEGVCVDRCVSFPNSFKSDLCSHDAFGAFRADA